jgi:hypothetical protein
MASLRGCGNYAASRRVTPAEFTAKLYFAKPLIIFVLVAGIEPETYCLSTTRAA